MQQESVRGMSTGELLRRLINNVSNLVDREVVLAKEEAKADAVQMGSGAGILIVGGLFLFSTVAALIAAAVLAIFRGLEPWALALIVAGIFAGLGAILAFVGYRRVKVQPLAKTRQTLKEDVQWAKTQVRSPAR
ncbi:MAG TPA: phage holin family protein [Chloroflexota bacterium]|nr:phage holin family protein [Chloroflexota bacterium]